MYIVRVKLSDLPNYFILCKIYDEYDKALEVAKGPLASFYPDVEILKINIEDIIKVEK